MPLPELAGRSGPPTAVRAAAFAFPDRAVALADLPELVTLSPGEREVCQALGIEEIRADDRAGPTDLAARAARQALDDAGIGPADVDALVVVESRAPETLMSSEATRLQSAIGAHRAVTFSVGGLGCVSVTPALLTARGLLAADPGMAHVLVAHGSKPATPGRYRHPVTVNGDGGMAMVVGRDGPVRVLDVLQETNGAYWDLFSVDYRGRPVRTWRERCTDLRQYSFRLALEGRQRLRDLRAELLARHGMSPEDVTCYLSHNLSAGSYRFTEEALDISVDKVCLDNLRRFGHLGPADVVLNLWTALERGALRPGERAVLLNASPVAAWSVVLVEATGAATTPR